MFLCIFLFLHIICVHDLNFHLSLQHINPAASALIKRMLHADPAQRPTIGELQADEFFTSGYIPLRLPTTCLTVPPRFSIAPSTAMEHNQRRPLTAINNKGNGPSARRLQLTISLQFELYPDNFGVNGRHGFLSAAGTEKVDLKDEPVQR